jgi:hypothetical protein
MMLDQQVVCNVNAGAKMVHLDRLARPNSEAGASKPLRQPWFVMGKHQKARLVARGKSEGAAAPAVVSVDNGN